MRRFLLLVLFLLLLAACGGLRRDDAPAGMQATPVPEGEVAPQRAEPGEETGRGLRGTRPPALTPAPSPTPGTSLEDLTARSAPGDNSWTVFFYFSGEPEMAQTQLEAVPALSPAAPVNVLLQLPAPAGAVRYVVPEEGGELTPAAEVEAAEDEAAALADFLAWGLRTYPATHYGLLIGGGGQEQTIATFEGLREAVVEGGAPRLDILGVGGCCLARLELLGQVQPFAHYLLASTGAAPADWPHASLLQELDAAPEIDGRELVEAVIAATGAESGQQEPFATLSALDLTALPAVNTATATLASALLADAAPTAGLVDWARAEASPLPFLQGLAQAEWQPALGGEAVDLGYFATLLGDAPQWQVAQAAQAVAGAVDDIVVASVQGSALAYAPSLAAAFPASDASPLADRAILPPWSALWQAAGDGARELGLPRLNLPQYSQEPVSLLEPAYVDVEVSGEQLAALYEVIAREDGERWQLLTYDWLDPRITEEQSASLSRLLDGVHETVAVWDGSVRTLSDGSSSAPVLIWPAAEGQQLLPGRLGAGDGSLEEAVLQFDGDGALQGVWSVVQGIVTPGQLSPGDSFQVYDFFLEEGGALVYEPGATFVFGDDLGLRLQEEPSAAGAYLQGFVVETLDDRRVQKLVPRTVEEVEPVPVLRAYLDPYAGFQFTYPISWTLEQSDQRQVQLEDPAGEMRLAISRRDDGSGLRATDLKAEALEAFGQVAVLYEEPVLIGGSEGLFTAYGYEAADGPHTGLLVAMINEDSAYLLDLDAPAAAETRTIAVMDDLISSWRFRLLGLGREPGWWVASVLDDFSLSRPPEFEYEQLSNGWHRFNDGSSFLALRRDSASGRSRAEVVQSWFATASAGVQEFRSSEAQPFLLAGRRWSRAAIEYELGGRSVAGFIMATIVDGEEIVAWAEGPTEDFPQLSRDRFLPMVADAVAEQTGADGLLYRADFEDPGSWGSGQMQGAGGEVVDGVYRLSVSASEGFFWTTAGQDFGDAVYEVEARQTAGPASSGSGLLFRADSEASDFYVFEVSNDGYVWIGYCEAGCARMTTLVGDGWFLFSGVNRGEDASNRLRVEARGTEMAFFVNGEALGVVNDDRRSTGDVGLFVETFTENDGPPLEESADDSATATTVDFTYVQVSAPR